MPIKWDKPLAWTAADVDERAMLADLQGNILKGHGRHATRNIFLRLDGGREKSRLLMRRLGALTINALDQLFAAETHKKLKAAKLPPGATPTFVSVMLTHQGYEKLDLADRAPDGGDAFRAGMRARGGTLADDPATWEAAWSERPDVLVLLADDPDGDAEWTSERLDASEATILNIATPLGGHVLTTERGRAIFRTQPGDVDPEGIEHFGYVDGRSQPLFLKESVEEENRANWDPAFPLKQLLVVDPASAGGTGCGSFFVFRKLKQDVRGFKEAEAKLQALEHDGAKLGEVAGAMIVGRFEDGGPATSFGEMLKDRIDAGSAQAGPVPNDFDYRDDMQGARCPFHAHIRKTNPRGDTVRLGRAPDDRDERSRLMARRGITYGERDRTLDPDDKDPALPQRDVGLLFMSYQRDIAHQFEFTQTAWANEPRFAPGFAGRAAPGRDPVIGLQGEEAGAIISMPHAWNDPGAPRTPTDFGEHVTTRGGDYFFAPARSTLLGM